MLLGTPLGFQHGPPNSLAFLSPLHPHDSDPDPDPEPLSRFGFLPVFLPPSPSMASTSRSELPLDLTGTKPHETSPTIEEISSLIGSLKKQFGDLHQVSIKNKMEENRQKLIAVTNHLYTSSKERRNSRFSDSDSNVDLLTKRQKDALVKHSGNNVSNEDNDGHNPHDDGHASAAVLLGSSIPVRSAVRPVKLTEVKKLPPYTTWIFLDRNQRMTEDQSVVGRRRIYYDQNGGEALICSDSEEEAIEEEEEKRDFAEFEDYILRMTIKEVGISNVVLEALANCFSRSSDEVKARYEVIVKEENGSNEAPIMNAFLDKDVDAALDSFDNLFCRRCLVFDCRLHGCSQDLVFPAEKPPAWSHPDEENVPCGPQCYRMAERNAMVNSPTKCDIDDNLVCLSAGAGTLASSRKKSCGPSTRKKGKSCPSESASSNAKNVSESSGSEIGPQQESTSTAHLSPLKTKLAGKGGTSRRNTKRIAERVLLCMQKRQKKMVASDSDSMVSGRFSQNDIKLRSCSRKGNKDAASSSHKKAKSLTTGRSRRKDLPVQDSHTLVEGEAAGGPSSDMITDPLTCSSDDTLTKEEFVDENIFKQELSDYKSWKAVEKGLFEKGVEIFGMKSCLIARNLLNGLKTCWEVYQYMTCSENRLSCLGGEGANSLGEGYSKFEFNGAMGNNEVRRRSRFLRRRGKVRRLKYTWKSAAYHSIRKRISERKDQPCRQYNPCGCQTACGKQCACLINGTCCEKYCGCPKSCKNRFRGCHCAKSQCRSRQCPCFAADRECDPDVCRNCWVSCGDGSLGVPNQRGDNYECRNMKLLLKQQQRVLLGRSDVSGWGAFLKNSVGKHEYLGEYTGELISHREADKRGKIYDRENSSFLFNLNDQFVLDAYRKGDKLKFANHSPDPNCYAKVIMVAGDHRVGIFAKERISSGEELFYDYRYEPDRAPAWARKPEASGSKKEDGAHSSGRAKKLA
ncbi:histone-lysine N-methyltransferase CLF [Tripterygium wilfordii]|uniref:Histone-lysine N-methyltransferase CLF n=1 Tax=Tripterygium wilfordii TaxID=458696 RepID=A0A7J7CPY1_TRIWF|nr:histone-lysine N-methyltransferase CLF [Tripterygium wilfordii]KAF5736163.1 histone-lysine N-methyltransferase CLF [Tripterygium wilfordii]